MKKQFFFSMLAAAAMMASCSSDKVVENQSQWNAEGEGYMAFRVAMPKAATTTRANDVFDDGKTEEYAVNDMTLLLFQGASESAAQLIQSYNVTDLTFGEVGSTSDNITSDNLIVQKIREITGTGNIYAFVVLNRNNIFKVDGGQLTIEGNPVATGTTFSTIQDMMTNTDLYATSLRTNGFLMMNAPLWKSAGGNTAPSASGLQILSPVDASNIKPTEALAKASPAAYVYVERAMAKVTMASASGTTKNESAIDIFDWTVSSWCLNNTNTKSYIIRNMTGFDSQYNLKSNGVGSSAYPYRFVGYTTTSHTGSTEGADHSANYYRTYFANDPNYSTNGTFNRAGTPVMVTTLGSTNPLYCAENVFDVSHQIWGQTTRAIVGITITPKAGQTLYAANVGATDLLTADYVKTIAYNKVLADLQAEPNFTHITGTADFAGSTKTIGAGDEVTVQIAGFTSDGTTEGNALISAYATTGKTVTSTDLGLKYYTGGMSYYQVRIKHFGDDLTPWNTWETGTKPTNGDHNKIYPDNSSNRNGDYLGRYGVLRNNWYDLTVSSVKKLGYTSPAELETDINDPGTPGTPDTPDDELENWISIDVNILSWAKRTQSVTL